MSYHAFIDDAGREFGSFEVFHQDRADATRNGFPGVGWYWQACFPGCLPDGEASGPYDTEDEAIRAARGEG